MLTPEKLQEKADILETNLFKSISKKKDPSAIQFSINREHFPDIVINKALMHLMPRYNVSPSKFVLALRDLLSKDFKSDKTEVVESDITDVYETPEQEETVVTRTLRIEASARTLKISINAVPAIPSINGEIAKSFFEHEQSPGQLLKDGIINFKEINRYPIVNAGDKLFFISHEKQGAAGVSFDGKIIPVESAQPFTINIGPGVEKVEAPDEPGHIRGYYLSAAITGVVLLERDSAGIIRSITITDEVEIKRMDYSVGNIGTHYTCPIRAKIGVICNGFDIRVNGRVQVDVVEGGHVTTNEEAVIMTAQSGSRILARKGIELISAGSSRIESEEGTISIANELIDSSLSAPKIVFNKARGLMTNCRLKADHLNLSGIVISGDNTFTFGSRLFQLKKDQTQSLTQVEAKLLELANNNKMLMVKLTQELKRMTQIPFTDPKLAASLKALIVAVNSMSFETIYQHLDAIQKKYQTKAVLNARKLFEHLERIPASTQVYENKSLELQKQIDLTKRRMAGIKVTIDGFLRKAATLKIYCGDAETQGPRGPDFMVECDDTANKYINITGTYSHQDGFSFIS